MTRQRQKDIFTEWLQRNRRIVFKVIRAYAFSAADQDDLFQEICIQLWKSIPSFREKAGLATWIYRISLNTAIKWRRSDLKHRQNTSDLNASEHDTQEWILQTTASEPDQRLDWLYEQIAKIDKIDRSLILLQLDGFSYREIAEILGISESNVGVKIHRIKKQLTTQAERYNRNGI